MTQAPSTGETETLADSVDGEALFKIFSQDTAKNLLKGLSARFKSDPSEENKLYEEMYRDLTGNDKPQDLRTWVKRALHVYTTCCDNLALGNHYIPKKRLSSKVAFMQEQKQSAELSFDAPSLTDLNALDFHLKLQKG